MSSQFVMGQASQVKDLDFPNFVHSLIQGVYSALSAADSAQVQDYITLMKEATNSLEGYRSDRLGDLAMAIGISGSNGQSPTLSTSTTLTNSQLSGLAGALPNLPVLVTSQSAGSGTIVPNESFFDTTSEPSIKIKQGFIDAISKETEAEYEALIQVLKLGISRTVVNSGTLKASFVLTAQQSEVATHYNQNTDSIAFNAGGTLSYGMSGVGKKGFRHRLGLNAYANYSRLRTSLQQNYTYSNESAQINYSASVELNISTNYVDLRAG